MKEKPFIQSSERLVMPRVALETDRFAQPEGVIFEDHETYILALTPTRADYLSGNSLFVLTDANPNEMHRWIDVWQHEFAKYPAVRTILISWETPPVEGADAIEAEWATHFPSYNLVRELLFKIENFGPLSGSPKCHTRQLTTEDDWNALLLLATEEEEHEAASADFVHWQIAAYRKVVARRRAEWWGAFSDGMLIGSVGVFYGNGAIRLEEARTRRAFRRRGIFTELCHAVVTEALAKTPDITIYILTAEGFDADRVCRRLGCQTVSRKWNLIGNRP